jgi:hypothetical protein
MAGLFGMTPEEQRALDMAEGQNLMSAGQQLGGGMLMYAPSMGRMQSESIMGALQGMGVSTPSQRKEEQVKAALQGLDYNNPASMMEAARKLLDLGMTAEAQKLVKAAQEAQESSALVKSREATATKNESWADVKREEAALKALSASEKLATSERISTANNELKRQLAGETNEIKRQELQVKIANNDARLGILQQNANNAADRIALKRDELKYNQEKLGRTLASRSDKLAVDTLKEPVAVAKTQMDFANSVEEFIDQWFGNVPESERAKIISQPAEFVAKWLSNEDDRSLFLAQADELRGVKLGANLRNFGTNQYSNVDMQQAARGMLEAEAKPEVLLKWFALTAQRAMQNASNINEIAADTSLGARDIQEALTSPSYKVYKSKKEKTKAEQKAKDSGLPEGSKPIGKTREGKTVYQAPNGEKFVEEN